MRVLGVIPARYGSSRLPGKPLLPIAGKPMIQWVYEGAQTASLVDELIVATDDPRIYEAVQSFGGKVELTRADHPTGTDRIAEVARRHPAEIIINIQGDQPTIRGKEINDVIQVLLDDPSLPISTARINLTDKNELKEPSVVKVVIDEQGNALYFSRAAIPYPRDAEHAVYWKHIGLYAYRHDFLFQYVALPQTSLELTESLEQLRVLAHGYRIKVVEVTQDTVGIDTQADWERVKIMFEKKLGK
ncbi:MAG TPA: 3-deoxy-manno-octulosonate cytidylyltransferase [Firmicutes bacterium]|nr:3-deoxy-manno-octulosonate cytidylyltransferase [Bacillota bacterium]